VRAEHLPQSVRRIDLEGLPMANKRKGQLTVWGGWARHLRPILRRAFWKGERQAGRRTTSTERSADPDGNSGTASMRDRA